MMTEINTQAIPNEIRRLKQWCLYDKNGFKSAQTFIALGGKEFSLTDLESYEFCYSRYKQQKCEGIAFYVSDKNSITVIELKGSDDYDVSMKYAEIIKKIGSYTESSSDGGFTILAKANINHKVNIKNISMNNDKHFVKITGLQCNKNSEIIEAQGYVSQIFSELVGKQFDKLESDNAIDLNIEIPISKSNNEILMELQYEDKNDYFQNLWFGNIGNKISKKEAQLQLISMISAKTKNKAQILEIFNQSPFSKEFNENTALLVENTKEIAVHDDDPIEFDENLKADFEYPPGRISELIEFIYSKSPCQVPEYSTLAAFGYVSAWAGRCFNYSDFGLNTYGIAIGNTGSGKEILTSGFDMINRRMYKHHGQALKMFKNTSDIASGQGLIKTLQNHRSSISIISEFGSMLSRFSQKNMLGADQSLLKIFLELYSKSSKDGEYGGMAYSDTKMNVPSVKSPAYSLLCESNPEFFYANLNERTITNGFLNRFTILEYKGDNKYLNQNFVNYQMSENLENFLKEFIGGCIKMNSQDVVTDVLADSKSFELADYIGRHYKDLSNKKGNIEIHRHLYVRNHMKIMKLASLMAVMNNPGQPVLDEKSIIWAQKIIDISTNNILRKFELGEIGSDNDETLMNNKILNCLKEYNKKKIEEVISYGVKEDVKKLKLCPFTYISKKNTAMACFKNHRLGATIAIKNTLKNLIELNEIEEMNFKELAKLGVKGQYYKIVRKEQEFI